KAWVNDRPVPFEGLDDVEEGRLLLSVRAIADHLGLYVHYDAATRQAIVADAAYPYVEPVDDQRPAFVPIDFANYFGYPIITPAEARDSTRTLLFSDSPETFREYGILYRDTVQG